MADTEPKICADCGTDQHVDLHNSREVQYGILNQKTRIQRFPGFLCIACWKLANPKMWKIEKKTGPLL